MSNPIENRYEFVYLFDVENGNPNGDPDAGNMPRIDPETSYGIVTDVCLKRKIRNFVEIAHDDKAPNCIYVKERAILASQQAKAYEALKLKNDKKNGDGIAQARRWMCQNFYDVRTFGAVMSLQNYNCGQVRGPVQINFGRSIDAIAPRDLSITRMAVATEKEAKSQGGDNRTMGRKSIVPYALYRTEGYVSACLAEKTGFGEDDLELLWNSLVNMFDHDRSAARGKMCPRKLIVFKHDSKLGNAPAHKLFETVDVKPCEGNPPRGWDDYEDGLSCPPSGSLDGFNGVEVMHIL
ncbi:CRISPR-associated protein Cas7/Csd2, subtype I-C/DVULG [Anaerohalosphaera lusitana]|uniref:CRISPR-associated protein Cas7/Csd2, subtype I-C/DVULG n=1 Tax=Anaerohalosphaera lusitana TaxID=1936003 RepID=A0A1U9NLV7_9BACT|nr:type I-C CRISPR-associated protein Cas7/Csd2 [Anaerohalosphaera lusitana]AQT68714.1 CRISPR-associated protein Cas7/Csd2, subtype I-C/DVULG [Anaerohalosphaera lusitana]